MVVLDEAQTLPLPVLRPCLAAFEDMILNCGASVVLCTAKRAAAWRRIDDALPRNAMCQPRALTSARNANWPAVFSKSDICSTAPNKAPGARQYPHSKLLRSQKK